MMRRARTVLTAVPDLSPRGCVSLTLIYRILRCDLVRQCEDWRSRSLPRFIGSEKRAAEERPPVAQSGLKATTIPRASSPKSFFGRMRLRINEEPRVEQALRF